MTNVSVDLYPSSAVRSHPWHHLWLSSATHCTSYPVTFLSVSSFWWKYYLNRLGWVMCARGWTCLYSSVHVLRIIYAFAYMEDETELKSNFRSTLLLSSGKWCKRFCESVHCGDFFFFFLLEKQEMREYFRKRLIFYKRFKYISVLSPLSLPHLPSTKGGLEPVYFTLMHFLTQLCSWSLELQKLTSFKAWST